MLLEDHHRCVDSLCADLLVYAHSHYTLVLFVSWCCTSADTMCVNWHGLNVPLQKSNPSAHVCINAMTIQAQRSVHSCNLKVPSSRSVVFGTGQPYASLCMWQSSRAWSDSKCRHKHDIHRDLHFSTYRVLKARHMHLLRAQSLCAMQASLPVPSKLPHQPSAVQPYPDRTRGTYWTSHNLDGRTPAPQSQPAAEPQNALPSLLLPPAPPLALAMHSPIRSPTGWSQYTTQAPAPPSVQSSVQASMHATTGSASKRSTPTAAAVQRFSVAAGVGSDLGIVPDGVIDRCDVQRTLVCRFYWKDVRSVCILKATVLCVYVELVSCSMQTVHEVQTCSHIAIV